MVLNILKKLLCQLILLLISLTITNVAFSQETDSTKQNVHFRGFVSVTNNGFSFIPTFSLGKPAMIVDLSVGKRFSFDPQFRFDLVGLKPWSFIFIWRYKLIQTERFQVKPGIHLPVIAFRTRAVGANGGKYEEVYAQRYFTPELKTAYTLAKNVSLGAVYIYGIGLEEANQSKHTHFFSLRSSLSNIPISKKVFMRLDPQVYYLKVDRNDGYYVAHSLTLGVKNFPLLLSCTMNKAIKTNLPSRDFDWNISLIYTFNNELVKK